MMSRHLQLFCNCWLDMASITKLKIEIVDFLSFYNSLNLSLCIVLSYLYFTFNLYRHLDGSLADMMTPFWFPSSIYFNILQIWNSVATKYFINSNCFKIRFTLQRSFLHKILYLYAKLHLLLDIKSNKKSYLMFFISFSDFTDISCDCY